MTQTPSKPPNQYTMPTKSNINSFGSSKSSDNSQDKIPATSHNIFEKESFDEELIDLDNASIDEPTVVGDGQYDAVNNGQNVRSVYVDTKELNVHSKQGNLSSYK